MTNKKTVVPDYESTPLTQAFQVDFAIATELKRKINELEAELKDTKSRLQLAMFAHDLPAVKIDGHTVSRRTTTSSRLDPELLLKAGVTRGTLEKCTVTSTSEEFLQINPPRKRAGEGDDE